MIIERKFYYVLQLPDGFIRLAKCGRHTVAHPRITAPSPARFGLLPLSFWLTEYADFSINFTIRFFIGDYGELENMKSNVMCRLWYAFKREGITIAFPIRDLRIKEAATGYEAQREKKIRQLQDLLGNLDLFSSLSSDDLKRLTEQAQIRIYGRGECLVHEGEPGGCF